MEYFARVEKVGASYLVSFPDFPEINTYGMTLDESLWNAHEALNAALKSDLRRGVHLPPPRDFTGQRGYYPVKLLPHLAVKVRFGN